MAKKLTNLAPKKTAEKINAAANKVHRSEENEKVRFNAVLPKSLFDKMKKVAEEDGISMTVQVIEGVRMYHAERDF